LEVDVPVAGSGYRDVELLMPSSMARPTSSRPRPGRPSATSPTAIRSRKGSGRVIRMQAIPPSSASGTPGKSSTWALAGGA
jgi:hypothetical protein